MRRTRLRPPTSAAGRNLKKPKRNWLGFASKSKADPAIPAGLHGELAVGDDRLVTGGTTLPVYQNPSSLVQRRKLTVFDDMKTDDQVRAALMVKKFSRLATPYTIVPASDNPMDVDIARFITDSLELMPGTFIKTLLAIMTALDYGYSLCEKNFAILDKGEWVGKVGWAGIKSRKPNDFDFVLDDHSNILSIVQQQDAGEKKMPVDKFIHYSYDALWENPYGTSDLTAAYEPWWSKQAVLKFWNMHLEKWASPILIGKYPPGTSQVVKDLLFEALEDLQIGTVAITPEGVTIEPLELKATGADLYQKSIDKRDRMICRSMLVPDLLGMGDITRGGSYALGRKQFDLFFTTLTFLGNEIEELLLEQLIKQVVDFNFIVDNYPRFVFDPFEEHTGEEKAKMGVQKAQTLQVLATAGFIDATSPEVQEAAAIYMNILPATGNAASKMAHKALSFKEPFKFTDPAGRDAFLVEIDENMARIELLEEALSKG